MKKFQMIFIVGLALIFIAASTGSARAAADNAATLILADKLEKTEGAAVCPDGALYVTETARGRVVEIVENDTALKIIAEGFKTPSGLACDPKGVLYLAEYGSGNVLSIDVKTGKTSVVMNGLKTPNAVVVAANGTIFASDTDGAAVYAIAPGGEKEKILEKINYANGLALSGDEQLLYVNSTMDNKVYVTPAEGPNRGKKKTFAKGLITADGITPHGDGFYVCQFSKGDVSEVSANGESVAIATGMTAPASPVVKDGYLYVTSLTGTGIYKIKLEAGVKENIDAKE